MLIASTPSATSWLQMVTQVAASPEALCSTKTTSSTFSDFAHFTSSSLNLPISPFSVRIFTAFLATGLSGRVGTSLSTAEIGREFRPAR